MSSRENLLCKINLLVVAVYISAQANSQLTLSQIDSLEKRLSVTKDDTSKVRMFQQLGNNVGYYDAAKALQYGKQGYDLSKRLNYPLGMARMLFLMGGTYIDIGNFPLADSMLTEAEKIFATLNDSSNSARLLSLRGDWNFVQGNYWQAADFYTKATQALDKLKDTANSFIPYGNLIAVLAEIDDLEKAVTLGKKVLKLAQLRNDSLQMGYTLQGLMTDLIYLNRLDEARDYLQPLVMITQSTIDNNLAADSYSTLGTYYYYKKDYTRAIEYYKKAIDKSATIINNFQLANYDKSIGSAYLRQNNFILAKQYLSQALSLAKQYNNKRAEENANLALSEYYQQTGDHKRAYDYLKQYGEIKDSILSSKTRNYASYVETLYETNKKENRILQLQKAEEEKDFALKKRNTLLAIGIGLITALITILYLLRRNYRNKQSLAKQQSDLQLEKIQTMEKQQQVVSLQSMINGQETERIRIAKDLHDGLGGIFSTVKMHYSTLQHEIPEVKNNALYRKTFNLIDEAADELRKVAHNMMPEVLMKMGLVDALRDFCTNISSGKLLKISFQTYGMEKRLNSSTEIMLYRIIQELINNIIKHAYATEAIIQFNRDGNRLSIIIEDNGKGFNTQEAEEKQTMGMTTVKSRVDYLNGKLTIDSQANIGTTVMIDLLLNEN